MGAFGFRTGFFLGNLNMTLHYLCGNCIERKDFICREKAFFSESAC